ncbi:hypothetical protein PHSY_001252 [Pseudozyma hubeiensis SY62]|uniref:Uncharacterized protein n=1 Tax=Pseudozyma hubeiensis (strain SY62) TaxID=1305764 RepID=R9NYH4_PSEHS|nr:hypothetical protein PHSY_001252 [Pseudozyma hubeiensis SY62]GAC93687.1 hypothetical protein PHSY_001252 [Pseudozyma hubeiensis SY62]
MDDDGKLSEAHEHKQGPFIRSTFLLTEQQDSAETSLRRRVKCPEVDKVTASSRYEKRKGDHIESFERSVWQNK